MSDYHSTNGTKKKNERYIKINSKPVYSTDVVDLALKSSRLFLSVMFVSMTSLSLPENKFFS